MQAESTITEDLLEQFKEQSDTTLSRFLARLDSPTPYKVDKPHTGNWVLLSPQEAAFYREFFENM